MLMFYAMAFLFIVPSGGINSIFLMQFREWLFILLVLIVLSFCAYLYLYNKKEFAYKKESESLSIGDFSILMLTLTPIIRYAILNYDILSLYQATVLLAFFALLSVVFCVFIPLTMSVLVPKNILIITSGGFCYLLFNMASLASERQWHEQGVFWIQALVIFFAILFLLAIHKYLKKHFALALGLFFAINTISVFFTAESLQLPQKQLTSDMEQLPIFSKVKDRELIRDNDIVFLVYEAYAPCETMEHYGIDNSKQRNLLKSKGFYIYDGIYSIGPCTHSGISTVFSVGYDIYPEYTRNMYAIAKRYIVNGAVQKALGAKGYQSLGIFPTDFLFRGVGLNEIGYDHFFPPLSMDEALLLTNSILEGEFRHVAGYDEIDYVDFFSQKHDILKQTSRSPYILYTHSNYPGHSQNSGQCLPDEIDIYENNLKIANKEMTQDINQVLQNNPDAIIVIAGDHGPYLTENCAALARMRPSLRTDQVDRFAIQDRYGAFLAIRWPEDINHEKYDIQILQDIFPAIFSYLFDDASLFEKTKGPRQSEFSDFIALGVRIVDGTLEGGKNHGEPLFLNRANSFTVPQVQE